jgi:transcriptional regulator with XRE-family HTH domain
VTSLPSPESTGGDPSTKGGRRHAGESSADEPKPAVVPGTARKKRRGRRKSRAHPLSDAMAARIRELRSARRWSQHQLAKESGLSKDAISRIERGDRSARLDTLEQIAYALGLPLLKLLDVGQSPPQIPESERRARLLQKSLEQSPPWLAAALPGWIRTLVRAARNARRHNGRHRERPGQHVVDHPGEHHESQKAETTSDIG